MVWSDYHRVNSRITSYAPLTLSAAILYWHMQHYKTAVPRDKPAGTCIASPGHCELHP